ncbi:MAG: hypothetical protein ACLFVG_08605 [Candidatus Aminicenantes bacterium]
MFKLSRIILGSNPFDGVSYLSRAQAKSYLEKFSQEEEIFRVMEAASKSGLDTITCAYNDRVINALERLPEDNRMKVIPVVPNAYDYVRDSSSKGIIGTVADKLKRTQTFEKVKIVIKGTSQIKGILTKDIQALIKSMLDLELAPFRKFDVPAVVLHGHIADLALVNDNKKVFDAYCDYIRNSFKAEPFIATHNFGRSLPKYEQWDLDITGIHTSFNKKGFMMRPSAAECEKLLEKTDKYILAKKILAGGTLSPEEAFDYVKGKNIPSLVVGLGSVQEVYHTVAVARAALI